MKRPFHAVLGESTEEQEEEKTKKRQYEDSRQNAKAADSDDDEGVFQDADIFFFDHSGSRDNETNFVQNSAQVGSITVGAESLRKIRRRKSVDSAASSNDKIGTIPQDDESPFPLDAETFLSPIILDSAGMHRAVEYIEKGLKEPMKIIKSTDGGGVQSYLEWLAQANNMTSRSRRQESRHREQLARLIADATIKGDPRNYQRVLVEMAKQKNTIVHLGTGYGKTLIALLLIKDKSKEWDLHGAKKKQTLFLVPSVALAIQQTVTLRANLPFSVETACYDTSNAEEYRDRMYNANILVATHGALNDLLMHYADLFHMSRFNLVVVDECHYCAGNHAYSVIMKNFYHATPKEDRPHVLGLTASPLINVRDNHSDEELGAMLTSLEDTLDATLVSAESLISDQFRRRSATEKAIQFQGNNSGRWLPPADNLGLHQSRFREFRQLQQLYENVGPLAVSLYCSALIRELARNEFENESQQEFAMAKQHLETIIQFCKQECHTFSHRGRTDKLVALEEILEAEIEHNGGSETVGLVFTDRRITAVALHNYFHWRKKKIEEQGKEHEMYGFGKAAETRRFAWKKAVSSEIIASANDESEIDDVFADSADDPFLQFQQATLASDSEHLILPLADPGKSSVPSDASIDQFMDAEDDASVGLDGHNVSSLGLETLDGSTPSSPEIRTPIRSSTLVRNITSIFNSLSIERVPTELTNDILESWLHIDHKVRDVLTKLRRKELNLLFATSVVEEGVDVQACSFVVAFDSIRSTKSYVQMKGRARKQNAKFYVFEDCLDRSPNAFLPLASAQEMERRIYDFIQSKTKVGPSRVDTTETADYTALSSRLEIDAVKQGFFKVQNGTVDLHSAKSLLNRYSMSVPLDTFVRTSKEALLAHMPDFQYDSLILPSHLPARSRIVTLPGEFRSFTKNDKQKMLSLMACVRLHSHGLLNDRLLPLSRSDMHHQILLASSISRIPELKTRFLPLEKFYQNDETKQIFVHSINHKSERFERFESTMKGQGHRLGLITFEPLNMKLPPMETRHKEFGLVRTTVGDSVAMMCSVQDLDLVREVFLLLMNERWRRQSRNMFFKFCSGETYGAAFMPYLAGIISPNGRPDWEFMRTILLEGKRTRDERKKSVETLPKNESLPQPRLWTSIINDHTAYVAYGPADETVQADFPAEKEGVESYHDYFLKYRLITVPLNDQLFDVQRYWTAPSNLESMSASVFEGESPAKEINAKYDMCPELSSVKVPQAACLEARLANAHVGLLTCFLPQVLLVYERSRTAKAFIDFSNEILPKLGSYLTKLPLNTVTNAMTAKSCGMDVSYEKLEWFGDAVLKMIQTESLLKSTELREWIQFLHEGDLSVLRQEMGCNRKLEEVCHNFGLERFILSSALARGQWLPSCLDFQEGSIVPPKPENNGKLYADIVESILGLIYLEFGYEAAMEVGNELQLTVTSSELIPDEPSGSKANVDIRLLECVQRATGYSGFRRLELLEEAFSHPSASNPNVSSFERLEWVGDAVLCLAAREWIWKNFSEQLELQEMVTMESALVSNEVLAFLSVQAGLHHFLEHRDFTLPPRIESYITSIQEDGCGLWGTEPPKSIADIVESLFGAIYTDGGISDGLQAATNMLRPICSAILKVQEQEKKKTTTTKSTTTTIRWMIHPKKDLQELVGELLKVETAWEHDFAVEHAGTQVLDGTSWRLVNPSLVSSNNNAIGYIHFMESILVAVSDASAAVARNKACAVMVKGLRANPTLLLEPLQGLRQGVERALAAKARDNTNQELASS